MGDKPGSSGEIIVDGFASLLASGGFRSGDPSDTDPHQMIIGRRGFGRMTVRNGGLVVTEAPPHSRHRTTANRRRHHRSALCTTRTPELGGTGIVTVNGLTSKWIIGGSLQIGGFDDSVQGDARRLRRRQRRVRSEFGTRHALRAGRRPRSDSPGIGVAEATDDDLLLAIGRFGELKLLGWYSSERWQPMRRREDNTQLLNDGVITGGGRHRNWRVRQPLLR